MAYGLSANPFLLKEGNIFVGTFSAIDFDDPESNFSGDNIGYFKQGTTNLDLTRVYAEFRSGTPSKIIRKDLTQKDAKLTLELGQWNKDLIELIMGAETVTNAGLNFDTMYFGSDEPTQSYYGYLIKSTLTNGKAINIALWYGKVTSESNPVALTGTEHATLKLEVDAFPHTSISTSDDPRNLGYIQIYT